MPHGGGVPTAGGRGGGRPRPRPPRRQYISDSSVGDDPAVAVRASARPGFSRLLYFERQLDFAMRIVVFMCVFVIISVRTGPPYLASWHAVRPHPPCTTIDSRTEGPLLHIQRRLDCRRCLASILLLCTVHLFQSSSSSFSSSSSHAPRAILHTRQSGTFFIFRTGTEFGYGVLIAVGLTTCWLGLCFRQMNSTRSLVGRTITTSMWLCFPPIRCHRFCPSPLRRCPQAERSSSPPTSYNANVSTAALHACPGDDWLARMVPRALFSAPRPLDRTLHRGACADD